MVIQPSLASKIRPTTIGTDVCMKLAHRLEIVSSSNVYDDFVAFLQIGFSLKKAVILESVT